MKSRRAPRPNGSRLGLVGGYGGSLVLVGAAVAVLLMPLLDDSEQAAGERTATGAGAPPAPATAVPEQPAVPGTAPAVPQQGQGTTPQEQAPQTGGRYAPPTEGGTLTWCPDGTATYRPAGTGLEVIVNVAASGLVRAEVTQQGRDPVSRQDTAARRGPHTLRFGGVNIANVERVKVTTVSVGLAMQTCYARIGA